MGSYVERFENSIADFLGAKHTVAAVNGTSAIQIALLVAGVQANDEVIVSTLTFIAPANAVRYIGAYPVFIDSEAEYYQMDIQKLACFLTEDCTWNGMELQNHHTGRRVKAILPVHILGHPVDMDPLMELAAKYRLVVIEDATECLGAKYKKNMAGTIGDIACFSFNGNKIITTGGGGMIATSNETWARKAKYLTTQAKDDPLEFIHNEIGYNFRLTNIQAAVGCAQMEVLADYIAIKRRIAATYNQAFSDIPGIQTMPEAPWVFSIYWMYTILIDDKLFGVDSRYVLRRLQSDKIQSRPLWQPMHLSLAHHEAYAMDCPVAECLNRTALSLPCSVGLKDEEQQRVIDVVCSCAKH